MKTTQFHRSVIACWLLLGFIAPARCHAHDTPIHQAITQDAALSSPGLADFLLDQFGPADLPFMGGPKLILNLNVTPNWYFAAGHSPIVWMKIGSMLEDEQTYAELLGHPIRFKNHFYDPTTDPAIGLTDGVDFSGIQSFTWASAVDGGALVIKNQDTWRNARDYQYTALTDPIKSSREQNLARIFYSLGHVLHLNQDLSQPDHTRNDNHNPYDPGLFLDQNVWIEPYGLSNFKKNPDWFTPPPLAQRGWSYWRAEGFTRLEAFWDRNLYAGNTSQLKQALDDDANLKAGKQLGLAEFSNGNFLGEDATYGEHFVRFTDAYDKHHFSFPSLYTSTTFLQIKDSMMTGDDEVEYRDGTSGTHVYVRKNADGVNVPHHSRLTYLGVKRFWVLGAKTSGRLPSMIQTSLMITTLS